MNRFGRQLVASLLTLLARFPSSSQGTCAIAGCPALVLEYYEGGDLAVALGLKAASPHPMLATFIERDFECAAGTNLGQSYGLFIALRLPR